MGGVAHDGGGKVAVELPIYLQKGVPEGLLQPAGLGWGERFFELGLAQVEKGVMHNHQHVEI